MLVGQVRSSKAMFFYLGSFALWQNLRAPIIGVGHSQSKMLAGASGANLDDAKTKAHPPIISKGGTKGGTVRDADEMYFARAVVTNDLEFVASAPPSSKELCARRQRRLRRDCGLSLPAAFT